MSLVLLQDHFSQAFSLCQQPELLQSLWQTLLSAQSRCPLPTLSAHPLGRRQHPWALIARVPSSPPAPLSSALPDLLWVLAANIGPSQSPAKTPLPREEVGPCSSHSPCFCKTDSKSWSQEPQHRPWERWFSRKGFSFGGSQPGSPEGQTVLEPSLYIRHSEARRWDRQGADHLIPSLPGVGLGSDLACMDQTVARPH